MTQNTKLKITFVLPFAALNGGNRVVAIYALGLRKRGHDVQVISQPQQPMRLREKLNKLRVERRWPQSLQRLELLDQLGSDHIVVPAPGKPLSDTDIGDGDFVIATWWETAEWVNALSTEKGRKVYFLQDYEMFPYLPQDRIAKTFNFDFLRITVSHYIRNTLLDKHGVGDMEIIPNAIDTVRFNSPQRSKTKPLTLGFLYQIAPRKNTKLALEAITGAKRLYPSARIIAFGAQHPTRELPLPPDVEFHHCPAADVIPDLYARCDLWLFTSTSEGFGLPLLEAMGCRTPVIATPAGVAPDLIRDGENGFLVAPTSDAFVEKITQVAQMQEAEWQAMSQAAQDTAHGWTWDDAVDAFEALLKAEQLGRIQPSLQA